VYVERPVADALRARLVELTRDIRSAIRHARELDGAA
jgi:hypothetical protein